MFFPVTEEVGHRDRKGDFPECLSKLVEKLMCTIQNQVLSDIDHLAWEMQTCPHWNAILASFWYRSEEIGVIISRARVYSCVHQSFFK